MHPDYEDIISRIGEEPSWYMMNGVPRYGDFKPKEVSIYADYSALYLIGCQDCGKEFKIGDDYTRYDMLESLYDISGYIDSLDPSLKADQMYINWLDEETKTTKQQWLNIKNGHYLPHVKNEEGENIYRDITIDDIVKNWGYGDPPNHGCVGDTMGCYEIKTLEVWDLHFGKEVDNGIIKKWGEGIRLGNLEEIDLTPDWLKSHEEDLEKIHGEL